MDVLKILADLFGHRFEESEICDDCMGINRLILFCDKKQCNGVCIERNSKNKVVCP